MDDSIIRLRSAPLRTQGSRTEGKFGISMGSGQYTQAHHVVHLTGLVGSSFTEKDCRFLGPEFEIPASYIFFVDLLLESGAKYHPTSFG